MVFFFFMCGLKAKNLAAIIVLKKEEKGGLNRDS